MSRGYTQREWDRVVGWGEVPPEYKLITEELVHERFINYAEFEFKKMLEECYEC